jgi:putative FmdB family regulatory protein
MPLYEYECDACGHRFETIQKFSDPPIEICPACGSKVHKLQSAPAFQFKGTGWYVTDYAKAGNAETKASKDTRKSDKDAAKADSQTDGKAGGADANSSGEKSQSGSSGSSGTTGSAGGSGTTGSTGPTGSATPAKSTIPTKPTGTKSDG